MSETRVMVVDDDNNICEFLRLYLEKEQYKVEICHDGREALDKFEKCYIQQDIICRGICYEFYRTCGVHACVWIFGNLTRTQGGIMMSNFKRLCAVVLSMAMIFSVLSTTAFAAEPDTEIKATGKIDAEYLAEMEAIGFTEADVAELRDWNLRVANADSMLEVDALMDEYYELVADTPLAASATATSFYSSTGGTLELDYTGSFSIFSNVIYTKVVYLPAQQVVYYQNAMYSEDFLDYIIKKNTENP